MSTRDWSFRHGIVFILIGGAVLFAAIFFGIRTGLAVKSGDFSELTPDDLMNQTQLSIGDETPEVDLLNLDGSPTSLREVRGTKRTVVAFVMPGCEPCENLLSAWGSSQIYNHGDDYEVILVVAISGNEIDLGEIDGLQDRYRVFACDHTLLEDRIGIGTFPTLIGFGPNGAISFVSNGYSKKLNDRFFSQFL